MLWTWHSTCHVAKLLQMLLWSDEGSMKQKLTNTEVRSHCFGKDTSNLTGSFNLSLIFGVFSLYNTTTPLFLRYFLQHPQMFFESPLGDGAAPLEGRVKIVWFHDCHERCYEAAILANKAPSAVILTALFNNVCSRWQSLTANSSLHVVTQRSAHTIAEDEEESVFFLFRHMYLLSFLSGCLFYQQRWFTLLKAELMSCWSQQLRGVKQWVSLKTLRLRRVICDIFWGLLAPKDSSHSQSAKASTKLPRSVSAWGNIHSCTGNDVLYISGSRVM